MEDSKWDIKVTSKGQITLPKRVRETMMVREGDHLQAVLRDDAIVLTKKIDLDPSEQMRLLAAEMLKELRYGEELEEDQGDESEKISEHRMKRLTDRRRLRTTLGGTYPDLTRLVREGRETK